MDATNHAISDLSHRAPLAASFVDAGTNPFEEGGSAIDLHGQKTGRQRVQSAVSVAFDWLVEVRGSGFAQQRVNVLQMRAEEAVEEFVLSRAKLRAVPPEPIAPFGDEEFLPRLIQLVLRQRPLRLCLFQPLAGLMQQIPRGAVLVVADPDRKVVRDPTAGEQAVDAVSRGMLAEMLADANWIDRSAPARFRGTACEGT